MLIFSLILISSCKKPNDENIEEGIAFIKITRYACGPACDAFTYSIFINNTYLQPANSLDEKFRIDNLKVFVRYRKTGNFPKQWEGLVNSEIVELLKIEKR